MWTNEVFKERLDDLKEQYYNSIATPSYFEENASSLKKSNELFNSISTQLSKIISRLKNSMDNDLYVSDYSSYLSQTVEQISNIEFINEQITRYKKFLKQFRESPDNINKVIFNDHRNNSKTSLRLVELQKEYNPFIERKPDIKVFNEFLYEVLTMATTKENEKAMSAKSITVKLG